MSPVEIDSHPVPLQIYNPQDSSNPAPNFHNVASIIPESRDFDLDSAQNDDSQRSPRSSPPSSSPQNLSERKEQCGLNDSLDKTQSQRITLEREAKCMEKEELHSSPIVSSVVDGAENGCFKDAWQICSTKSCDSKLMPLAYGAMNFRRSPRFMSPCVDNKFLKLLGRGCDAKTKSGGNTTNSLQSSQACNIEINLEYSILSDSLDEQPFKRIKTNSENSDLGILDTKFLMHSQEENAENTDLGILDTKFLMHSQEEKADNQYTSKKQQSSSGKKRKKNENFCCLIGDPLPSAEAQERWHWRYEMKNQRSSSRKPLLDEDDEDKIVWNVECHYAQAEINGSIFELGDCAYVEGDGDKKHVGRIVEFFKTTDGEDYFRVQWFYRVEDTVIQEEGAFHDKKRLFYSTVMNDNPIDCIISKVNVVQKSPNIGSKRQSISPSGFYFDMEYSVEYSSFRTMHTDYSFKKHKSSTSPNVVEPVPLTASNTSSENMPSSKGYKAELSLLDLFSGCGGMSTGLCLGAKVSSVDLVTRWALDCDKSACESFKLNHPETHVRNEAAQDFLELLKQWEKLCKKYAVDDKGRIHQSDSMTLGDAKQREDSSEDDVAPDEYEVSRIVDVCYGDPDKTGDPGLRFKVHWKGYSSSEDTWEPAKSLSNCQECIRDFVICGLKSKLLPLPGDVGVICGGPPCQGISGYNRFRNVDSPLSDERNRQIIVFMDIVQFLKPKFVLMENVVDILKFDKASLARYALSRMVHMKYQARLGTMAAGCYGLPQFRLRVFMWGAHPSEKLPQFPLPTHDVIIRYWPPNEFERNTVAYDENQPREVEEASVLRDAISDLPPVTSHDNCEELTYEKPPETDFQRFIRSTIHEMTGTSQGSITKMKNILYDHRPYAITEDDYARLCLIPKQKGANFRDLPGVIVGNDNVVRRDPATSQVLPSGKPLVPDFAFTYEQGRSKRPYARVWWDETVSTVVTFPDLHCQIVVHPEQDRVLTIRECARLQGFPDYYRFSGSVKKRYRQIGNAVAVPVGRALGYALGMAFQKLSGDEPLMKLPPKFSYSTNLELTESLSKEKKTDPLIEVPSTFSYSTNLELTESLSQEKKTEPLIELPPTFSYSTNLELSESLSQEKKTDPLIELPPMFSDSTNVESAESLYQKADEDCYMQPSLQENGQ